LTIAIEQEDPRLRKGGGGFKLVLTARMLIPGIAPRLNSPHSRITTFEAKALVLKVKTAIVLIAIFIFVSPIKWKKNDYAVESLELSLVVQLQLSLNCY
jgi:hypothetical protein